MPTVWPMMSVVVATRDRLPVLRRCVDSLRAQRYPRGRMERTVVVAKAPPAGTPECLRAVASEEPWIRVVSQPVALGFAARNRGIAVARGELVAITDDDCTVADDWLPAMATAIEREGADAVGGHV